MKYSRKLRKRNSQTKKEEVIELEPTKQEAPTPAPVIIEPCNFSFQNNLAACLKCNHPGCCVCCMKACDIRPAESDELITRKKAQKQKDGIEAGFVPDAMALSVCHLTAKTNRKFKTGYPVYLEGKPCQCWISAVSYTEIGRRFGQADFWCDGR